MKTASFLTIITLAFVGKVLAHEHPNHASFHHKLHIRVPGMPDNRNPETPKEDLGEQEPGKVPEAVVPSIMPEGLGSTFCKSSFGFCGSKETCCAMGGVCCPNGGCCNEPGMGCFPDKDGKTHCCKVATEKLCTSKTCIPKNSVCCKNGSYCAAGSYCVKGGCCKAGMICKQKTGAKSSGHDTRAVEPQKIKAPPA